MIEVSLKAVSLTLLIVFISIMLFASMVFIKAIFKFPTFRDRIWHGITNGDAVPDHDDFQRTAQLFWAGVFGVGLVCSFLLWMAYPDVEAWKFIVPGISLVFLGCIGLRKLK